MGDSASAGGMEEETFLIVVWRSKGVTALSIFWVFREPSAMGVWSGLLKALKRVMPLLDLAFVVEVFVVMAAAGALGLWGVVSSFCSWWWAAAIAA